ncbi:unnamed protein product [Heligmosomoides polygyrus]|uniref:Uncharacterized protein n=1 Tax=Heligmosomoides polygyrus TaxID=6339 RepID=A0A183G5J5_HELPZ|nr:unnamed protein product [Heligmosomoides polygyrus]
MVIHNRIVNIEVGLQKGSICIRWNYREAREAAKKAVAAGEGAYYADVNEQLRTRDGENCLYRLAKARCRQAADIEKSFGINDENIHILMGRKSAMKPWHDYFEEISNKVTVRETEAALRKMKSGKTTGLDDLPADLSKSKVAEAQVGLVSAAMLLHLNDWLVTGSPATEGICSADCEHDRIDSTGHQIDVDTWP